MAKSSRLRVSPVGGLLALLLGLCGVGYAIFGQPAVPAHFHAIPAQRRNSHAPSNRQVTADKVAPPAQAATTLVSAPEWVSIPRLQISAPVVLQVHVQTSGLEKGLLSAPNDFHDLGWYDHGTGVLVIDGHVGFAAGSGPLAYIGLLSPGNVVIVRNAKGPRTYTVSSVDIAKKGTLTAKYFAPAYNGDIMLITCDYQSAFHDGHFADNLFVIAKPAS